MQPNEHEEDFSVQLCFTTGQGAEQDFPQECLSVLCPVVILFSPCLSPNGTLSGLLRKLQEDSFE